MNKYKEFLILNKKLDSMIKKPQNKVFFNISFHSMKSFLKSLNPEERERRLVYLIEGMKKIIQEESH